MTDEMKSKVDKAIGESVAEFVRGVRSHNSDEPDVTIPDDVVEWLQDHKAVKAAFEKQLGSAPDKWGNDGPQVCRAAFHAGSLAAFRAFSKPAVTPVNRDDVRAALIHISSICKVGTGERWIYCPWWPVSPPTS